MFYLLRLKRFHSLLKKHDVRRSFAALRRWPAYLRLIGRLALDARTPLMAKLILAGTVAYILSPLDFIPDLIPFAGATDDLSLLAFALNRFFSMIPESVRREREAQAGLTAPVPVPRTLT